MWLRPLLAAYAQLTWYFLLVFLHLVIFGDALQNCNI